MFESFQHSGQRSILSGIPAAMSGIFGAIGDLLRWRRPPSPNLEGDMEGGLQLAWQNMTHYQLQVGGYLWRAIYQADPEHYQRARLESDRLYQASGRNMDDTGALA